MCVWKKEKEMFRRMCRLHRDRDCEEQKLTNVKFIKSHLNDSSVIIRVFKGVVHFKKKKNFC